MKSPYDRTTQRSTVARTRTRTRTRSIIVVLASTALVLFACNRRDGSGRTDRVVISGSSALVPLLSEAGARFMRSHPEITVQVSAGGSRQGMAQVASGAVTLGASDVPAEGEAARSLVEHPIAVVAVAAMAHRGPYNERITSLTREQLRGIFTGRIRNWAEVGGSDQVISVINRARNSGTRAVFRRAVLAQGEDFVEGVAEQDNSGQLQSLLTTQRGAISYLALSYRHPSLRVFAVDGVEPSMESIASGQYPITSRERLYSRGAPTAPARAFIDFVRSAPFQNDVVVRLGFVPIDRVAPGSAP